MILPSLFLLWEGKFFSMTYKSYELERSHQATTNGYGAVIALIAALIVLIGQKMLIAQTNKDFTEMQLAEKQFQATQNSDYLRFIEARATQMLRDNKVLSEKGKKELERLLSVVKTHLA